MNKVISKLVEEVVDLECRVDAIPRLPPNEEAKIENDMAIDHLYFSSALEGTRLNKEQLNAITHGQGFSEA